MRCAAAALVVLGAAAARADDVHYQDYPVGNRAAVLGGAFTAVANEPSGAWYNPAGIAGATRSNVSVSTSLYGVETDRPANVPHQAWLRLSSVAGEAGAIFVAGTPEPGRNARLAGGFDVIVPSSLSSSGDTSRPVGDGVQEAHREMSDRTLWAGLAGALAPTDRFSIGASFFLVHRSLHLFERATGWSDSGHVFHEETNELDTFDDSLVAKAGVRWTGDPWSFGLALETPSVPVFSGGKVRMARLQADAGGAALLREWTADTDEDAGALRAATRVGGALRAGAAWIRDRTATAACDLVVHLPVDYERLVFRDHPEFVREIRVPSRVERRWVVDGACGGEWKFSETLSVAAGAWTDFSSSPPLRTDAAGALVGSADNVLPHVNLFGATASLGLLGEYSLTRLGLSFATGSGQDARYDAATSRWVADAVSQTFAFVFVASTFRY